MEIRSSYDNKQPQRKKSFFSRKKITIIIIVALLVGGTGLFFYVKNNKTELAISSLNIFNKISKFVISSQDTQKEIDALNTLVQEFTKKDGQTRSFLFLLQNNMELRPGGGFLGQYAVFKIKDGAVISSYFEDANLLDQRITAKITPPYPLTRMMQIKKWKFRDSNFSPDFPTNVEKAKYFYRLAGGNSNFDGVIAVNASVLNDVLVVTGPISIPGYNVTLNSENAVSKLEEIVEKAYIMDPELDTQNRKAIMKTLTTTLVDKLMNLSNISKLADLAHKEMQRKNIMLNFTDANLQSLVESVYWGGKVATDWSGDYFMTVDANMGALKTDHYIQREYNYEIDLTQEKPQVYVNILYKNTAPYGDWRTSDYHSYLRVYAPKGATLLERKMVSYPNIQEEFDRTSLGFILHVLIGRETNVEIKYELPEEFPQENYRLLVQKQSGIADAPIKVKVKTKYGEFEQSGILNKDLTFKFEE